MLRNNVNDMRGGAFYRSALLLTASFRNYIKADFNLHGTGFRIKLRKLQK